MDWITRAKNQQRVVDICTICDKALVIPPRKMDRFSLHLICDGSVLIKIGENLLELFAPCVLCVDESKPIEVIRTQDFICRNIIFNPTFLNINMTIERIRNRNYGKRSEQQCFHQMEPFLAEDVTKRLFYLNSEQFKFLFTCFDHMEQELKEQNDWYFSCRARSFFMDIIGGLDKISHGFYFGWDKARKQDDGFSQIASFIEENLDNNITLPMVCSKFSFNRNKVESIFKENVMATFYQYLKQQRMERACYFLRFTELSLIEIAERTGFSSSQNFSRFFSSVMNQTPIGYRRSSTRAKKR